MRRISEIEIQDILGTRYRKFAPKTLTILEGENGSGKSSICDAVLAIFEGGHDPGWLRKGARKGFIRIVLDDGTTITKTVTAKGSTVEILDSAGTVVPKPQAFIESLAQSLAVNPMRLLLAKPKELLAVLLEIMPISFSPGEVSQAVNGLKTLGAPLNLEEFDSLSTDLYNERTACNRVAKDASATFSTLMKSIGDDDDKTDWSAIVEELEKERTSSEVQISQARDAAEMRARENEHAVINEINAKMAELAADRERRITEIHHQEQLAIQKIDDIAQFEMSRVLAELAAAKEKAAAKVKRTGAQEQIEKFGQMSSENYAKADKITDALAGLEELRRNKISSLPIPGVEIRDGQVYIDGVEREHVNTARLIDFAFQVSALRGGQLPFMVLDKAEHLDGETWEAMKQYALSSGFQVLVARVADSGPLRIEALDAQPEELITT